MRELDPPATTVTRPRAVRGCREVPGLGGDRAQEVVRHAAAVSEGHLVGGDVQARVQLYLVGVHNLAAQRDGHVDRQLRLAGPRGADDHHQQHPPSPPPRRSSILSRRGSFRGATVATAAIGERTMVPILLMKLI
jgi:hypothetical protein